MAVTTTNTSSLFSSRVVEEYATVSIVAEIEKQLQVIVKELATEIIDRYEIQSVVTKQANVLFGKDKLIMTVVLKSKDGMSQKAAAQHSDGTLISRQVKRSRNKGKRTASRRG